MQFVCSSRLSDSILATALLFLSCGRGIWPPDIVGIGLKYFEGASSSDSDVDRHAIIRNLLDSPFGIQREPDRRPDLTFEDNIFIP
jgi:hypothetical protein